jgi:hypothetical protein
VLVERIRLLAVANTSRTNDFSFHVPKSGFSPASPTLENRNTTNPVIAADNRLKPHSVAPTDEERVKLHQTMTAYAGTYSVEGEKVIHHVDISWNEAWTGTDQIRFYKLEGNTLTIKAAPNKSTM